MSSTACLRDCFEDDCISWHKVLDAHLLNTIQAHALKLRVLQLGCNLTALLMPMDSLQHILVLVGQKEAEDSLIALGCAHNLRTLVVARHSIACGPLLPGDLDLSTLSKLEAVSLRYVAPTGPRLPAQCRLSVKISGVENAQPPVWATVRDHLVAFHVASPCQPMPRAEDLPVVPHQGKPIEKVRLSFKSFG